MRTTMKRSARRTTIEFKAGKGEDLRGVVEALADRPIMPEGDYVGEYVQQLRDGYEASPVVPSVDKRGVYIASKAKHGPRWRTWRAAGVPIISTWIDEAEAGLTSDWRDLWTRCIVEASNCAALVIYREDGEELKGALIEAGAAIAEGNPVFAVGLGGFSVLHHPYVIFCDDLTDAFCRAKAIAEIRAKQAAKPTGPTLPGAQEHAKAAMSTEQIIEQVKHYDVNEGDNRRRFTVCQMEVAIGLARRRAPTLRAPDKVTELVSRIEAYCRDHGITTTTFGRYVANDGKFVGRLKSGSTITLKTLGRIEEILSNDVAPSGIRVFMEAAHEPS